MKVQRIAIICLLVIVIISFVSFNDRYKLMTTNVNMPPKGSTEELYQDLFLTLLNPTINSAMEKQYGGWVPYDIWTIKVLRVNRMNSGRVPEFSLNIEVMPYKGPHNAIGIDHLTINVLMGEAPKVVKFEHVKNYQRSDKYGRR